MMSRKVFPELLCGEPSDGTGLDGHTIVIFEDISLNGAVIASHRDMNDTEQMIRFPEGKTSAKDDKTGEKLTYAEEKASITDTATYRNLIAGKTYTVTGTLMDKEKEKPVTDADGKPVTDTVTFTAEKSFKAAGDKETVTTELSFSTKGMEKLDLVVFEELYVVREINGERKEIKVADHSDLSDKKQTVNLITVPKTGDGMPVIPVAGVGICALIGMGTVIRKKKRK